MRPIIRLMIIVCLVSLWYKPLLSQENWSVQHIVDNDDVIFGISQGPGGDNAPRDNRGLALSHDGQFLYLGYNNPSSKRVVRKIDLSETDPARNHNSVVKQLQFASGAAPAKSIDTDDKGRVYLARGSVIDIYNADLNTLLYTISGFNTCEGVAVQRESGTLVVYASDRANQKVSRFVITEGSGDAIVSATKSGLDGDGEVTVTGASSLRGLDVQSNGTIWVADISANKVFRIKANGDMDGNCNIQSAIDVAIDEGQAQVYVTQYTVRTIKVLNMADFAEKKTLTPPWSALNLTETGQSGNGALSGIDLISGQVVYVANETGQSIMTGDPPDSPFSNVGDDNVVYDDDNDPVLKITGGLIPVELQQFGASVTDGLVKLFWSTATETENLGFHLFRSLDVAKDYQQITTELIKGSGSSAEAQTYTYTDRNVQPGQTYYYKLADVDFAGNLRFHGPISVTVDAVPSSYSLSQNYPNPFNPETAINFSLKEPGKVTLRLYNLQGQLVRTLLDAEKLAGSYSLLWNGTADNGVRLASGIYYYTLKVNGFEETKKLTLMK